MSVPPFLGQSSLRLVLFGGKGGVGKTSCATAAAVAIARNQRVLLLSTDPAHSLRDSLADLPIPKSLQVVEFDARGALEQFRRAHGKHLQSIAERGTFLDSEDIERFLKLSLPGMDELFAFLDIARRAETNEQDCIVVDTAPTGHTLRLLEMPGLLRRWIEVLDTLLAKHRYMKQLFGRAYAADELDHFLDQQRHSVDAAESLLTDAERCRFVPVMIAEELSVRETTALLVELDRLRIPAPDVIVNMLAPASDCGVCAGTRALQMRELQHLPESFASRSFWSSPLRPQEVRGSPLEAFWDEVTPFDPKASSETSVAMQMPEDPVVHPGQLPSRSLELLLVAGKGGVGKTTIACATAVRLARDSPKTRILLCSTDPAHSVGDCLDRTLGPEPKPVLNGLMAMEIDAQAEFMDLKRQYREDLDAFFGTLFKSFDVPFDREVMEQIIELSPPGLDEIMALTKAMDLLASGRCDLLLVDTAPTGHLIRLLELPDLISDWLKAFFEVFLKYREVFGLPAFSERLVRISKDLHRFRSLLRDSNRSALYAVALPTRMAVEETRDLLAACKRMALHVPVVFVNMMTPTGPCPFCAARARLEKETEAEYSRYFGGHVTQVFRQPELRGLERLGVLGQHLYERAS